MVATTPGSGVTNPRDREVVGRQVFHWTTTWKSKVGSPSPECVIDIFAEQFLFAVPEKYTEGSIGGKKVTFHRYDDYSDGCAPKFAVGLFLPFPADSFGDGGNQKRYLHKDGQARWGEVSVSAVHGLEGRPRYS
jgi:hypothetical protein